MTMITFLRHLEEQMALRSAQAEATNRRFQFNRERDQSQRRMSCHRRAHVSP